MLTNILLPILFLSTIYALVIVALVLLLRVLHVPAKWRIALAGLAFGIAAGMLVVWLWPLESIWLYNLPAQFLGYEIYLRSIQTIGIPNAENAHETIPWLLRIPQVMGFVSIGFWGGLGLVIQAVVNRRQPRKRGVKPTGGP